jgi:hypothetical protein
MNSLSKAQQEELGKRPPVWQRPGYRVVQRAQRSVFARVFVDRAGDQHGTTWVIGGPRSGTTWIAEAINYRNEYRFIAEPIFPGKCPEFAHFLKGQYVRPQNQDPRFREPLTALLTGRIRHPRIDGVNCNPAATRRLIKDVHANLLARWVYVNLPGAHIVFVIRHPLAVMTSRMDLAPVEGRADFDPDLARFLQQEELMADFLAPFETVIRDARTPLEQYALWWCVENYVFLRQFDHGDVHTLCYEDLRWRPSEEVPRLAAYLRRDLDGIHAKLGRPSRSAYGGLLHHGIDPGTAWTIRWSADEVREVMKIIAMFGLDQIYTDDPRPKPGGLQAAMSSSAVAAG